MGAIRPVIGHHWIMVIWGPAAARLGSGLDRLVEDVADRPPARDRPESGREAHHLRVTELPQRLDGVLAAVAGVLRAAKWSTDDAAEVVVYENHPDIDAPRHAEGAGRVGAVDGRGQSVLALVHDGHGLVLVAEAGHGHYRAEYLLAGDSHVAGNVGEQGRRNPEAVLELGIGRERGLDGEGRSFVDAGLDVVEDPLIAEILDLLAGKEPAPTAGTQPPL